MFSSFFHNFFSQKINYFLALRGSSTKRGPGRKRNNPTTDNNDATTRLELNAAEGPEDMMDWTEIRLGTYWVGCVGWCVLGGVCVVVCVWGCLWFEEKLDWFGLSENEK